MATLDTVAKLITDARVLLLDTEVPYRYSDESLISALNVAVLEARRVRPDLFVGQFSSLPSYNALSDPITIEAMYRPAFVYYVTGRAQLRDSEDASDQRASAFLTKFTAQLLSVNS